MGQTRNFLDSIQGLITVHRIGQNELISKYAQNSDLEHYYRNQIAAFDQKLENKLRELIDQHIQYLDAKDPYGRQPLHGAIAKKNLFISIRSKLETLKGAQYINAVNKEAEKLLANPVIDQPRWPKLNLDNIYHFFKSMFSNPNSYLDKVIHLDKDRKTAPKSNKFTKH